MILYQTDFLEQSHLLIQACINGDRTSQNQLYKAFAPKMFGVCLRYSKNKEEAEEICQEGFIQIFMCLHKFKFAGSFQGWMRKIMVNCAVQHYRSKPKLHAIMDIDANYPDESGEENITAHLGKKELLLMVQKLPPAYRMVFNLYIFEGMKHREIAEHLGISEGTSKSNLYDARAILQKLIKTSLQVAKRNESL